MNRLKVSEERRRLTSVEDGVDKVTRRQHKKRYKERLTSVTRNNTKINQTTITRKQK